MIPSSESLWVNFTKSYSFLVQKLMSGRCKLTKTQFAQTERGLFTPWMEPMLLRSPQSMSKEAQLTLIFNDFPWFEWRVSSIISCWACAVLTVNAFTRKHPLPKLSLLSQNMVCLSIDMEVTLKFSNQQPSVQQGILNYRPTHTGP